MAPECRTQQHIPWTNKRHLMIHLDACLIFVIKAATSQWGIFYRSLMQANVINPCVEICICDSKAHMLIMGILGEVASMVFSQNLKALASRQRRWWRQRRRRRNCTQTANGAVIFWRPGFVYFIHGWTGCMQNIMAFKMYHSCILAFA